MTKIKFYKQNGLFTGFEVKGHSTLSADDEIGKIVCSAVSSAAYLTANTLIEVIRAETETTVKDGYMQIKLKSKFEEGQNILKGFELHVNELCTQYHEFMKVYSEV
jgi:uncharacterized protein YsxB (DUF464 family)